MATMKVLHVTGVYPSTERPDRGIFIHSQIQSLKCHGIEATVFVLEGRGVGKYVTGIAKLRNHIRKVRPDLIHAHYMYSGWTARLASSLPLVVSYMGNDVLGDCDENGRYGVGSKLFHRSLSLILAKIAQGNITKSDEIAGLLATTNTAIIPNGVDLELFRPLDVNRITLGLVEGKFYILFAGRESDPVKQYSLANKAIEVYKSKYGEVELVSLGGMTSQRVAQLMNAVDCLLLTSAHEGSPNIVKEALACNLPIISVNVGDVAKRLSGVDLCFVVPRAPDSIAQTIHEVRLAGRRSNNARESVRSLDQKIVAEKIVRIYHEVLKN